MTQADGVRAGVAANESFRTGRAGQITGLIRGPGRR
jgi:hypothetical protein